MKNKYFYETKTGTFYIAEHNGRFHPILENESLRSYATIIQVIDDLVSGHTLSSSNGIDTSTFSISDNINDWEKIL